MNIVCVICSDLLTPSDDVFHTPCGHIFHYVCLLQWLERAQTCPQCRERTTTRMIHRIYFNFSNNDSILEDTASLQQKIDNMTFQLKLKDANLDKLTNMNEELKSQTVGLRHEVLEVEREVIRKRSAINALKDQVKIYKQQSSDVDDYKKENNILKSNLEHLKNIQTLVNYATSHVDTAIIETSDSSKLITYITVLKRELSVMSEKSKEIREKYKNTQQKYMRMTKENQFLSQECAKNKKLEDELVMCESEKISLQTQLNDLQTDARKCVCNKVSENKPESLNEEWHSALEESNVTMNECAIKIKGSNLRPKADDACITIALDKPENTSQNLKSQGFFSMSSNIKRQNSSNNLKIPSILVKKPKFNQPRQETASSSHRSFDGFGGHAKYDEFPKPILNLHVKRNREVLKMRKPKLDMGDNKKISDVMVID